MRTTAEVIEAARLGDPCTEEELRLAIVSMRMTAIFAHMDHARWSIDETLPATLRAKAKRHWESINEGWHVPLDVRVEPHNRPGPEVRYRAKVADAVWDRAQQNADKKGPTSG